MPIYECHSFEDEEHDTMRQDRGYLFDGRWILKQTYDYYSTSQSDGSTGYYYLGRTDIFGHQDEKRIILPSGKGFIRLLSEYLGFWIKSGNVEHPQRFWALRLDWKHMEIKQGDSFLEIGPDQSEAAIVDRAGPLSNGDICFLMVKNHGGSGKPFEFAHHCRLDSRELNIIRDNQPIPLDSDDFNCVDLNGDIISGLTKSLLEIKRYNFRTRNLVDSILVHGLPSTICCLWHKNMNNVNRTPRGAWTDNYLFVWSKEGDEFTSTSSVYHVDLETGVAASTAQNFKGWIKEFVVGPDGNHLYLRVDEFLRRSSQSDLHYNGYFPPIYKFRYLRVPFNRPDSLFFLAAVALPRPLPLRALEIIQQNSKTAPIPIDIVKI